MRTFEHFPEDVTCKICGTNEDKECCLIPIDGTSDGSICEAIPTHVDCLIEGGVRYKKEINVFYILGKE